MTRAVLRSDVAIDAELVWLLIRDFHAVGNWNPMVRTVVTQGEGIGSERTVEAKDAGRFVERLEKLDDSTRSFTYSILESPLPLANCTIDIHVIDNGNGTSTVELSGNFDTPSSKEFQSVRTFQRIYQEALDNLVSLNRRPKKD